MNTLLARVMKQPTYKCVSVLIAICLYSSLARSATDDPLLCIGLQKQLLVDDHVLAKKKNLRRVLGQVTKANQGRPIMVADKPWESGRWGLYGFYGTVLHDGDKFRMWYNPWRFAVAYAESSDGLNWQKPALNLYDFSVQRANKETQLDHNSGFYPREDAETDYRGKANNIIGVFGDGFTCYLDPHESDPDHRYKACYGHPRKIRACLAHSRDGIHWTPSDERPTFGELGEGLGDCYTVIADLDCVLDDAVSTGVVGRAGLAAAVAVINSVTIVAVFANPENPASIAIREATKSLSGMLGL